MKFNIGDRVKVYDSDGNEKGTIIQIITESILIEFDDDKGTGWYHPKQCRKLKKKEKEIKKSDLTFGQALDLLNSDEASRIGCWNTDDIYVYFSLAYQYPILMVRTIDNRYYPWFPNQREMLESKWRVIE